MAGRRAEQLWQGTALSRDDYGACTPSERAFMTLIADACQMRDLMAFMPHSYIHAQELAN